MKQNEAIKEIPRKSDTNEVIENNLWKVTRIFKDEITHTLFHQKSQDRKFSMKNKKLV